jgi:hypothetical protein
VGEFIAHYWQLVFFLLTTAGGVGITLASIRNTEMRLNRLETHGTAMAQETAKRTVELERRMEKMEDRLGLLDRIDERTEQILGRLERMERRGT